MRGLWELFVTFVRIGAVTFGGGYAMLPILQRELVDRRGWTDEKALVDYYALGQSLPGVIGVNTAAFIGYARRGAAGAVVAALGVVVPSLVIIMVIAASLRQIGEAPLVQHALAGVRVAVVALIVSAILRLWKQAIHGVLGIVLMLVAIVAMESARVSPIVVVLAAAALGVVMALGRMRRRERDGGDTERGGGES